MQNLQSGQESPEDSERRAAAIRLLSEWLREDQEVSDDGSWDRLKAELDRDRPSERPLFVSPAASHSSRSTEGTTEA